MDLVEHKQVNETDFKRHPWELTRFRILIFFIRHLNHQKKYILDIGSGDAFVSAQLSKNFPDTHIYAIDINYDDQFISENDSSTLHFSRSLHNIKPEKIDLVLLMDVLEHIEKPEELISEISQLKNIIPSTTFFITVPAFQSLFTQHDVFLGHFRRYSHSDLTRFLNDLGFEIRESGYFFFSLLLIRFFQKYSGAKKFNALHNWKGNHFKTSVVKSLLWMDFKISWYLSKLGIRLPGLSCYCLCNRLP